MKVNHESAARLPDRCGLGGVDGRVQPIPGRLEGVVPRRRFEHISIRIELAPIQEIEHQMRAMTSARGEGIGNEARESHRVRVVSIDAGSALSLGKPEWPRASAMRRDDDERSVTGYVFDPAIASKTGVPLTNGPAGGGDARTGPRSQETRTRATSAPNAPSVRPVVI